MLICLLLSVSYCLCPQSDNIKRLPLYFHCTSKLLLLGHTVGSFYCDHIFNVVSISVWYHWRINIRQWSGHGLVVKAEDSQLSGCGFKSRHRRLDCCKCCWLLQLKKIMKIKVAKWGTPKKLSELTFLMISQL